MSWAPEKIELLKAMWTDGKTSSQIAKAIGGGISRNAVLGKAMRLGLSVRTAGRPRASLAKKVDILGHQGPKGPRIKHLCFAAACDGKVEQGNFCEKHSYKAPANVAQMTRGRA